MCHVSEVVYIFMHGVIREMKWCMEVRERRSQLLFVKDTAHVVDSKEKL